MTCQWHDCTDHVAVILNGQYYFCWDHYIEHMRKLREEKHEEHHSNSHSSKSV